MIAGHIRAKSGARVAVIVRSTRPAAHWRPVGALGPCPRLTGKLTLRYMDMGK